MLKIYFPSLLAIGLLVAGATITAAQTVEQLESAYSGKLVWNQADATLRFTSSGDINFTNAGAKSFIWQIPPEVKQVRIAKGVTVNGAFHSKASVTIAGEDRKTSVVYGTDEQRWSQNRGIKAFTICTFQNFGGVMTISNLTSLNPRGFHVRGWENVVHAASCDFLDRRGGHHNNSDGFEGGDGSTVHDCYFESGDDIIKVYHDVTVTDTTIKMITNSVPIQLGWGNYSDGAVGTFRNLRVLGSGGRMNEGNAIISGRQGRYNVTVNIDGCHIENPNGTLVSLREDSMTLRGAITNARIKLRGYAGEYRKGTNLLTVCGSSEKRASYDCLPADSPLRAAAATAVPRIPAARVFRYQNPISDGLDSHGVRDCQVFRDGAKWYMTPTAWPHWPRQETSGILNPGVVLYSSENLFQWKLEKVIVPAGGADKWYHRRFWAPEVHKLKGKYYVTFNASNPDHGHPGQHTGFAVADSLLGPYRVVTEEKPLSDGNDLTLFEDDDGKVWAFWNRGREFGIGFAEVDLKPGKLLTEPKSAIVPGDIKYAVDANGQPVMEPGYDGRPQRKVAKCADWDSIGIEGAYVIKRNGTYYLFYSSWTRGYEIGYATAPKITGPWTKAVENPFYGEQSASACQKNGLPYTGNPDNPFNQVGHNEIFTGPDGRLWLSCHGILKSKPDQPMLVIDPLEFDANGRILRKSPTHTLQEIKLP